MNKKLIDFLNLSMIKGFFCSLVVFLLKFCIVLRVKARTNFWFCVNSLVSAVSALLIVKRSNKNRFQVLASSAEVVNVYCCYEAKRPRKLVRN